MDTKTHRLKNESDGDFVTMKTPVACVLATLGFACLTVWGTYIVFAPALPLLSFGDIEIGTACLIVSRVTVVAALLICALKPDVIYDRMKPLVFPGSLALFVPAFVLAVLCWAGIVSDALQTPLIFISWILLGAGELALSLSWTVLFSMMPAKWTALSIAGGGALATPLFLLVGGAASPFLGLVGLAFVVTTCDLLAFYLLSKTGEQALQNVKTYRRDPTITVKAALSVGTNGLVYGYVAVMLVLIGLPSVLIAAAAGVLGAGIALLWAVRRTKSKWDIGTMQRATVPLVAAAILFIPFCDDAGRTLCGAVAVGTFAYATLMEWTDLVVSNAEFQLYPVKRYAKGRLPQWAGFTAGALVAFVAFHGHPLAPEQLMLLSCVIAVLTIAAFSLYGADDSETKEALLEIMTTSADNPPVIDPPKNAAPFRDRCEALAQRYDLSQREAEVFVCLAKGRNADYIQQKLFISSNTAKTHIGHIYKKMGINSQQRLIDLVDHQVDNGDNAPSDSPSNSTRPEVEGSAKRIDTYGSMPIDSKAK